MTGDPVIVRPGEATRGHTDLLTGPAAKAIPEGFIAGSGAKVTIQPHCGHCHRRLAEYATEPWSIRCPGCKRKNHGGTIPPDRPPRKDGITR